MYVLTHSLVLVLVVVMKPKVLKTKISHGDPPTHSLSSCALIQVWYQDEATQTVWVRGTTDGETHAVHVLLTPDNVEVLGFTPQVCVSRVSPHN